MAKRSSNRLVAVLGRLLKAVMVVVVVPAAVGLLQGMVGQFGESGPSGEAVWRAVRWGGLTYLGIHLLLIRPEALFRASHRLFSMVAVWLFGGQVGSVESAGGGEDGKGGRGARRAGQPQGSTLVAFSPYVIPLPTILVCAISGMASGSLDRSVLDAPTGFLIGLTIAFHWLMTAEELQAQRERWHLETYLLAIGLVFVITLIASGACLPWAVPGFSFTQALAEGLARAQAIYAAVIRQLFW